MIYAGDYENPYHFSGNSTILMYALEASGGADLLVGGIGGYAGGFSCCWVGTDRLLFNCSKPKCIHLWSEIPKQTVPGGKPVHFRLKQSLSTPNTGRKGLREAKLQIVTTKGGMESSLPCTLKASGSEKIHNKKSLIK